MQTRRIGFIAALTAILLISAVFVTTCMAPVDHSGLGKWDDYTPPPGKGYIVLKVANFNGRTILPDLSDLQNLSNFDHFDIIITDTDDNTIEELEEVDFDDLEDPIELDVGFYNVEVLGYYDDVVVAAGKALNVEVTTSGGLAEVTIKEIVDGEEDGTFIYDFTFATALTGTDTATLEIIPLSGGTDDYEGAGAIDLLDDQPDSLSGTEELKSGYYRAIVTIEKDGFMTVIRRETIHIYQGLTTTYEYDFPAMTSTRYLVEFDVLGGATYEPVDPADFLANHGETLNEAFNRIDDDTNDLPAPTRTYFLFGGWWTLDGTSDDEWGTEYNPASTRIISPIALFARWIPNSGELVVEVELEWTEEILFLGAGTITTFAQNAAGNVININITNATDFENDGDNIEWFINGTSVGTGLPLTLTIADLAAQDLDIVGEDHELTAEAKSTTGIDYSLTISFEITAP